MKTDKVITTAVVGSYPKPRYLFPDSGRSLLDSVGAGFWGMRTKIGPKEHQRRLDRAVRLAIRDQVQAGVDIISDGEERRDHYIMYVLRGLEGIDFEHLEEITFREGKYKRMVPVIVNRLTYRQAITVEDFRFARSYARKMVKVNLPGPATVADTIADRFYQGDRERIARAYALVITQEVGNLINAGCREIQFDDPVLKRNLEAAGQWGIDVLESCVSDYRLEAQFYLHICRGYPDPASEKEGTLYKAPQENYAELLDLLQETSFDIVSIEGAQGSLDLSVLAHAGSKKIMLGVLDVGNNQVEPVGDIAARGREALSYLPPEQLILSPDCGMIELNRDNAKQKLKNLSLAAKLLNREIDGTIGR